MNLDRNQPDPPPKGDEEAIRKLIWLAAAFIPSIIGIACLHIKSPGPGLFPILGNINVFVSLSASIELLRGIKSKTTLAFAVLFPTPFFFILNALIVVFVGCSGMGRISS